MYLIWHCGKNSLMNVYEKCHMYGLITGFFCTIKFNQMKTLILLHNSGIVNPTLVKQYQKKYDEICQI